MIEFEDALDLLCQNVKPLEIKSVPVADSVGYVLAEDIYSPIAMPPFNKSAMDGYAFRYSSSVEKFRIKNLIQAGDSFNENYNPDHCVKIMTGAAVPDQFDTVVEVERAEVVDDLVSFTGDFKQHRNVCFLGEDIEVDQCVLKKNIVLKTSHTALIATVGLAEVKVYREPSISLINTGGEIVEPGNPLEKNQIYNSNGTQMLSLLNHDGNSANYQGIVKDDPQSIKDAIVKGMESDILLITGGVSMGDYDFVPKVLKDLGVKQIFHKVKIKPGKPLLFGKHDNGVVIGIPGNPVSNFMAYQLFIKTVIEQMKGNINYLPKLNDAVMSKDFTQKNAGRKTFLVSQISRNGSTIEATPVKSNGSGDIFSLSLANGAIVIDTGIKTVKKGEVVKYISWEKID